VPPAIVGYVAGMDPSRARELTNGLTQRIPDADEQARVLDIRRVGSRDVGSRLPDGAEAAVAFR